MAIQTKYFVTELVAEVGSLPSLATQVVSLTADPDCDIGALSRLILSDTVLTMRFLALANSAIYAHGQEIKDLRGALVRLGIRRVRNVALLMGMHDMTPRSSSGLPLDLNGYWQHCLAVASCAHGLAGLQGGPSPDDAWLVGILHGLGVNALTQRTGDAFTRALNEAQQLHTSLANAEMRTLGFHHGELGARILRAWHLPRVFAEVVEFHAEDFAQAEVSPAALKLIGILRSAIAMARAIGYDECGDAQITPSLAGLTARLGLSGEALQLLAANVDREVRELADLIGLSLSEDRFSAALAASHQTVAQVGLAGLDDALVKEGLEDEMAAARGIQNHILPQSLPAIEGFELAAVNHPSKLVSGDTYDFISLPGGAKGFFIADVSGKGMPAALLASTLQASLRALTLVCADPGTLLAAANRALCESTDEERFATLFLAVLQPDGTGLSYASAGHNPPLLLRDDGQMDWLKPAGTPLGLFPGAVYPVTEVELNSGDLLIAYTDGVTEAANAQAVEFGPTGLAAAVATVSQQPVATIITQIIEAVGDHVAGGPGSAHGHQARQDMADDLTLLALRKSC